MTEEYLAHLPGLDPINRTTMAEYIRQQEIRQLRPRSIQDKAWRAYYLLKFLRWKDARTITKTDIEDYIIHRRKTVAPRTLQGDLVELRIFLRFIAPEKEGYIPKIVRPATTFPDPLTREEIGRLVAACDTVRDRALVMFLWDTGCRLDEALSLNIGMVRFDEYGGNCKIGGKTGEREAWLIDCVPDLQNWINAHPKKGTPDAPLWITYSRYGFGGNRLNQRTVQNLCKRLAAAAGIPRDRVHPHAFRHARATDRARDGFREMELRIMFGWSKSSNMPAVYIHLSGADVKRRILERAGMEEKQEAVGERPLDPVKCPRCGYLNAKGFYICARCNTPLTADAMREKALLRALDANPEFLLKVATEMQHRKDVADKMGNNSSTTI